MFVRSFEQGRFSNSFPVQELMQTTIKVPHLVAQFVGRSSCASFCISADPVGRLEPLPDAPRVDRSATHPNRNDHAHLCCFSCRHQRSQPAHPATTGPLATLVGRATGMHCLLCPAAFGKDSPFRYPEFLGTLPRSGCYLQVSGATENPAHSVPSSLARVLFLRAWHVLSPLPQDKSHVEVGSTMAVGG